VSTNGSETFQYLRTDRQTDGEGKKGYSAYFNAIAAKKLVTKMAFLKSVLGITLALRERRKNGKTPERMERRSITEEME
jgi:hypothetical protein